MPKKKMTAQKIFKSPPVPGGGGKSDKAFTSPPVSARRKKVTSRVRPRRPPAPSRAKRRARRSLFS